MVQTRPNWLETNWSGPLPHGLSLLLIINTKRTLHKLHPTSIHRLWSLSNYLVPYQKKLHSPSFPLLPHTTISQRVSKQSLTSMAGCFWLVTSIGFVGFILGLILNHFLPLFSNLGPLPKGSFGWPLLGETLSFLKPHPSNSVGAYLHDHCSR